MSCRDAGSVEYRLWCILAKNKSKSSQVCSSNSWLIGCAGEGGARGPNQESQIPNVKYSKARSLVSSRKKSKEKKGGYLRWDITRVDGYMERGTERSLGNLPLQNYPLWFSDGTGVVVTFMFLFTVSSIVCFFVQWMHIVSPIFSPNFYLEKFNPTEKLGE